MNETEAPKKKNVGKIIGFGCLALAVAGVIGFGCLIFGVTKLLKSNAPYKDSIAAAQSNPDVIDALGEPVKPGFFLTGSLNINNGVGDVSFQIPVSGPNGSGTILVEGDRPSGSSNWNYTTWELDVKGSSDPIPLSK